MFHPYWSAPERTVFSIRPWLEWCIPFMLHRETKQGAWWSAFISQGCSLCMEPWVWVDPKHGIIAHSYYSIKYIRKTTMEAEEYQWRLSTAEGIGLSFLSRPFLNNNQAASRHKSSVEQVPKVLLLSHVYSQVAAPTRVPQFWDGA